MWADQRMKQTHRLSMGSRRLGSKKKKKKGLNRNTDRTQLWGLVLIIVVPPLVFSANKMTNLLLPVYSDVHAHMWINTKRVTVRQVHCPRTEDGSSLNVRWCQKESHCEAAKTGLVSEIVHHFLKLTSNTAKSHDEFPSRSWTLSW